ncbi:MAG: type II toxin-antitoxin system VapC family toxin [Pyrinomonadaceae bacterium]
MLLDTSGLMCLFDQRDSRHASATKLFDSANRRLTHNYVFAEFVALAIARRAPLSQALLFIEAIHNSDEIKTVWVDPSFHERAIQLLTARHDKLWSLCDAVSFVLMNDESVERALTTDHNFEQAGFVRLLSQ